MGVQDVQTRVLFVDDEPVIVDTMTAILERGGFVVRSAEDGFAALVALRQTLPDSIISDLRMPNMSGFEFLSVVRRRFPHIPVIAISGEYLTSTMRPGLLADAFLQKGGYTPDELFESIRQLISDSPIRPHLAKPDKAPLWIPRRNADYVVATCPECLRSFPVDDASIGSELRESECPSCGTKVQFLVDSAVLKMLAQKEPATCELGRRDRCASRRDTPEPPLRMTTAHTLLYSSLGEYLCKKGKKLETYLTRIDAKELRKTCEDEFNQLVKANAKELGTARLELVCATENAIRAELHDTLKMIRKPPSSCEP